MNGMVVREAMDETQTKTKNSALYLGLAIIGGLAWISYVYSCMTLPNVTTLRYTDPTETAFMRAEHGTIYHVWRNGNHISQQLKRAVIAAEDDQFYDHPGFDWPAIKRAAEINWRRREFAFGASTITQQVAKNLYLSSSTNPLRKFKELLIALALERDLEKRRILEIYLNIVEWAPGVYGAQAAAQHYFQRDANALSASQAAFLASILPNPRTLGARGYRRTKRARAILRRM
jgi:monofunctional glycosyltransferase